MKAVMLLCSLFFVLLLSGINAEEVPQGLTAEESADEPGVSPRITCDLMSWGGFNHSLCAAHCLLRGNRGGYCNDKGVCICRN